MTVCSTCKHANYCEIVAGGYSSKVKSCRDYRKGEMTNEEWFCNLDTEDKAREISDMTAQGYWSEELVEKWLKEKHE